MAIPKNGKTKAKEQNVLIITLLKKLTLLSMYIFN
jgi:hypothetical protein